MFHCRKSFPGQSGTGNHTGRRLAVGDIAGGAGVHDFASGGNGRICRAGRRIVLIRCNDRSIDRTVSEFSGVLPQKRSASGLFRRLLPDVRHRYFNRYHRYSDILFLPAACGNGGIRAGAVDHRYAGTGVPHGSAHTAACRSVFAVADTLPSASGKSGKDS